MVSVVGRTARVIALLVLMTWQGEWHMSDSKERNEKNNGIPEMTEKGGNPGWQIRVGVSRDEVKALAEADEQGVWFDSEEELNTYVRSQLDLNSKE